MTHPGVYIAFGVVAAVGFVIALFASQNKPQPTGYGRGGSDESHGWSPPPSPPQVYVSARRRRRSPERRNRSPPRNSTSANQQSGTCSNCKESPYITVSPCNHKSLCKGCFENRLENNDTCPSCLGRIDSLSPPISPFGKCKNCRKFTKLFKFLPCKQSLSLCIKCFEEERRSYKNCPHCVQKIRGSEPSYATSGICKVCGEFTPFAKFQPCNHHDKLCRRHALQYLESSGQECGECGNRVTEVV